jgi:hypothetical protein
MNPGNGNPHVIKPAGPIDPDVGLLAVESAAGRPIAALGNYALHYVGGMGAGHISADYFANWADTMSRAAGVSSAFPPFVPILTNACSGDINGINVRAPAVREEPYEKCQRVAETLAGECYRLWRSAPFTDSVELNASEEQLELGVRLPPASDVAEARKTLAAAPGTGQFKERPQIYARETIILNESYPKTVITTVQALRIGPLGIATLPGEAFVELGLELKAKSPFRTVFPIELANDYRGYLPTVEGHELGGYETWRAKSSYLEKQAAPKLVAAALRQLGRIAG